MRRAGILGIVLASAAAAAATAPIACPSSARACFAPSVAGPAVRSRPRPKPDPIPSLLSGLAPPLALPPPPLLPLGAAAVPSPDGGRASYAAPILRPLRRPFSLTCTLAFLAGVSDVACHSTHGCYANMMTGNCIRLAQAVSAARLADVAFFATLLCGYMAGFGAYRAADELQRRRGRGQEGEGKGGSKGKGEDKGEEQEQEQELAGPAAASTSAVVAPAVFLCFALHDVLCRRLAPSRWLLPLVAVGSAMVNSAGAETTGAVTCMMTGNLQKVANRASDGALHLAGLGPRPSPAAVDGARRSAGIVASFALGIGTATALAARVASMPGGGWLGAGGGAPPLFAALGATYAALLVASGRPPRRLGPEDVAVADAPAADAVPPAVLAAVEIYDAAVGGDEEACELDSDEAECLRPLPIPSSSSATDAAAVADLEGYGA